MRKVAEATAQERDQAQPLLDGIEAPFNRLNRVEPGIQDNAEGCILKHGGQQLNAVGGAISRTIVWRQPFQQ